MGNEGRREVGPMYPELQLEIYQGWIKQLHNHYYKKWKETREKLFFKNKKLVYLMLRRFCDAKVIYHKSTNIEDLEQVGMMGLLEAIDRYNPSYGARFSTFACKTIRCLMMTAWTRKIHGRSTSQLKKDVSINPLTDVLANVGSVPGESRFEREAYFFPITEPEEIDEPIQLDCHLAKALSDREKTIIQRHFFDKVCYVQIGKEIGISRERVRQIAIRALSKLKDSICGTNETRERGKRRPYADYTQIFVTIEGEEKSLSEWIKVLNIDYEFVSRRVRLGWDPKDALLTPKLTSRYDKRKQVEESCR